MKYTHNVKTKNIKFSNSTLSPSAAQYYNSDLSIWLSVDPLADKYPNLSPYTYCAGNPVRYFDPNGKEKIDAYGKRNSGNNQNKEACSRYKDNTPVIHLWAHGNKGSIQTFNPETNEREFVKKAEDMHNFLCEHSNIYQTNSETNEVSILVLHSCNTGAGENNIAQQISGKLNLLVVAPTDEIWGKTEKDATPQAFSYEVGVNNTYKDENGNKVVGKRGAWNIYYKGIKVDSFDGHTKPNFKDPQKIIEKYEKKYQEIMSANQ